MIRAVVDTNITVSALLFGGLPFKIVQAALSKKFIRVTSPFLIEEAERVMSSDKFGLTAHEMKTLTSPIFSIAEIVIPTQSHRARNSSNESKNWNVSSSERSFKSNWN